MIPKDRKTDEGETAKTRERDIRPGGPAVPGIDDAAQVVSGQDEVDDLLSSLGF